MQEYKYKAMDAAGRHHTGIVKAKNELDLEYRLENQGFDLISSKLHKRVQFRLFRGSVPRRELINMVFHLEQLTASGVPIIESLTDLRDSVADRYFRDLLSGLVEAIEGGSNLSGALAQFPQDFDEVFVALIAIGEESGELPRVLHEMGSTMRKTDELIANAKRVMMYPSIVGAIIVTVAAFLLIFLVPKIIPFVEELGGEIPFHTVVLIAASDFVAGYWWLVLSVIAGIYIFIKLIARARPEFRYALDGLKLRIPIAGSMGLKIRLVRFATYMALLYGAGVTVLRALEICEALMDNTYLGRAIATARQHISDGGGISDSFSRVSLFPPLVIRMLRVGESTGKLDDALMNVSYFYDREIQEAIETIEPTISPIMTVTMGALLGWIMLSILGPVWNAATGIQ
ncbi:MAG: type II secretion system F family protein [Pseudomonadales bacterium]|nr:type II secretion system F family protein [Pseudomonadales bacterium]